MAEDVHALHTLPREVNARVCAKLLVAALVDHILQTGKLQTASPLITEMGVNALEQPATLACRATKEYKLSIQLATVSTQHMSRQAARGSQLAQILC